MATAWTWSRRPSRETRLGTAKILIDGKAPSSFAAAYAATRPTPTPICWFPSIARVTLGPNPVAEDWTVTATEISKDGTQFNFRIQGSVTGRDGEGITSGHQFTSKSGRIHIDPGDWQLAGTCQVSGRSLPDPLTITWKVILMGTDVWVPKPNAEGAVDQYTLIQGIPNTEHTLELIPNGDGPVPVSEIIAYRPPLD